MTTARKLAIITIFGVLIFVTKAVLPPPLNKMLVVIHAFLLALGSLLLKRMGATYVSVVGGVLTAIWNTAFAPFSFSFALLYGLLVDVFIFVFRVDIVNGKVKTIKLTAAMMVSTTLTGFASYFVTTWIELIPRNLLLEIAMLIIGSLSGALAGYLASIVWNKRLIDVKI